MINGKLCPKHAQEDRVCTGGAHGWGPGHPIPKGYTVQVMDGQRAMIREWCAQGRNCGEAVDYCGIPNKANYYVHVIIGKDVPGGTETSDVDMYVCHDHMPAELLEWEEGAINPQEFPYTWDKIVQPVRSLFKFDSSDEWEVLEFRVSHLR